MGPMGLRTPAVLVVATLAVACAHQPPPPAHATATHTPGSKVTPSHIKPSQLLPDLAPDLAPQSIDPSGTKRFLIQGMRLEQGADGSLRRARGLLPGGRTSVLSVELPSRLGGGFLLVGSTSSRTQIWHAPSWLAPIKPLLRLDGAVTEAIPGFDRVYLRGSRDSDAYSAIDPSTGSWASLDPLPPPIGPGQMVFADAWRAVSVVDFRGPMATFDAGASWFPLELDANVTRLEQVDALIVLHTSKGAFSLDASGRIAPHSPSPKVDSSDAPDRAPALDLPLGRRPLRTAIERGIPLSENTVLVAERGNLTELSTVDGRIVRVVPEAYPQSFAACQGIPLGGGVGFVCGKPRGETVVYSYQAPATLRAVMSFNRPRAVMSSGNGAIVVHAPCPGSPPAPGLSQYCIRHRSGRLREIRFQGDVGAERVAALADGRILVIIAPRPGAEGRLVVLAGVKAVTRSLSLDALSRRQRALVRRGLWMHGPVEIKPGVVGLWVEAGGPIIGLHIRPDGKVKAGAIQSPPGAMLAAGRFGLVWRHSGHALETLDGGLSWSEIDLPPIRPQREFERRGCSSVGCVIGGWMRIGWGAADNGDDLEAPNAPKTSYRPFARSRALQLVCAPTGRSSVPPAPLPKPRVQPRVPGRGARYVPPPRRVDQQNRGWVPFGSAPAPVLKPDDVGIGAGREYGSFRFRAYAWGGKTSDWTRNGQWVIRFDDPYDPVSPPRSSAMAVPPWTDVSTASMHLNGVRSALLEPDGRSAVLGWCPSPNRCELYGFADGEAPLPLTLDAGQNWPPVMSMVRNQEGWFLLGGTRGLATTLYAADRAGHARVVGEYPRLGGSRYDAVALVRRARGTGVGVLTAALRDDGASVWFVLPIEPQTGSILEAVSLGPRDLGGEHPPLCAPEQNGWLVETNLPVSPSLRLPDGRSFAGSVRVRLRMEAGVNCLDWVTAEARARDVGLDQPGGARAVLPGATIPFTLTDRESKRKYEMLCKPAEPPG